MKFCNRCGIEKEDVEFYTRKDGTKFAHCKRCNFLGRDKEKQADYLRRYRIKNPGWYLKRYGLSFDQYASLLEDQNGGCALCGKTPEQNKKNLAVDHDHKTMRIRGLLCSFCNHRVIGKHTNPELLRRMADYVEGGTDWFVPPKKPKKRRKK